MKKIILLSVLMLLTLTARAQTDKHVTLNGNTPTAYVTHNNVVNVFFTCEEGSDENFTSVKIEVENLNDDQVLLLFSQRYSEGKKLKKELKRDNIIPDKWFHDAIEPFQGLQRICKVSPQNKVVLTHINVSNGEDMQIAFPVYIGTYKDKKHTKVNLMNLEYFTVTLRVDQKEDANYQPLKDKCDRLTAQTICPNNSHKPKVSQQKQQLDKERESLIAKLEKERDKWWGSSRNHHLYQDLINTLQDHTFQEADCGKHKKSGGTQSPRPTTPTCAYANYSSAQIKQKLDNLNTQIYNSSNRAATKSQVMRTANALYDCYKNHNHGRSKNAKIDQVYQKICSY